MISSRLKMSLRKFGRLFGLEIRLNGLNSRDDLRFVSFLEMHRIDTVLDVGANRGQFARDLIAAGYKGSIVSFEPLPDAHAALVREASRYAGDWRVAPRKALSDTNGTATFHVTDSDTSSSLLTPLDTFVQATPAVAVVQKIEVETARLDDLIPELGLQSSRIFLKLDVQGSEARVLEGASNVMDQIYGLVTELSFAELYAGQSSPVQILEQLSRQGFDVWDVWRGYSHPKTYRLNQVDALFFRTMQTSSD
jgi:FkbM family methyltransferase